MPGGRAGFVMIGPISPIPGLLPPPCGPPCEPGAGVPLILAHTQLQLLFATMIRIRNAPAISTQPNVAISYRQWTYRSTTYASARKNTVKMIGFCQTGRFITFPLSPATVGTPPFAAALVDTVPVEGKLLLGTAACGTGMFVAPPIIDSPGKLLAYAPLEMTGCGAGGATIAFDGASGTS